MSTPSDTPGTDVRPAIEIYEEAGLQYADSLISRDFARQLERELAAMTKAAKQAVMERDYYQARAKELETLLVNTVQSKPSFPC